MEVLHKLPAVLNQLGVEYMQLAELIEIGIPLSDHYLISLARRTLGEEFLNASEEELEEQFSDSLTPAEFDGIAALLLLGQLPHLDIDSFSGWLDLLDGESPTFRRAMYPSILAYAKTLPTKEKDLIWANISASEALLPPNESQLDLLYDLAGPDIVQSMDTFPILENNPRFLLRHLNEIAVISYLIIDAIETSDYELINALVKRYTTPDNVNLIKKHHLVRCDLGGYQEMLDQLNECYPELVPLVERT